MAGPYSIRQVQDGYKELRNKGNYSPSVSELIDLGDSISRLAGPDGIVTIDTRKDLGGLLVQAEPTGIEKEIEDRLSHTIIDESTLLQAQLLIPRSSVGRVKRSISTYYQRLYGLDHTPSVDDTRYSHGRSENYKLREDMTDLGALKFYRAFTDWLDKGGNLNNWEIRPSGFRTASFLTLQKYLFFREIIPEERSLSDSN